MAKLKKELDSIYKQQINVLAPKNCHTVSFNFVNYKTAKFVGKMVDMTSKIFENSRFQNLSDMDLLKSAQDLEIKQSISLTKMIEMDEESSAKEETKKNDEDEKIVMEEFDDNFVVVEGLYVQTNSGDLIVHEDEIEIFTSMSKNSLSQTQIIPYTYDIEFFIRAAKDLFDTLTINNDPDSSLESEDVELSI